MPIKNVKSRDKIQLKNKLPVDKKILSLVNTYGRMTEEHPFPVLIIDSEDLSIKNANKAACTLYGYSKKSFSKIKLMDIDITLKNKSAFHSAECYKRKRFVTRHLLKNGAENDVEIYNSSFIDQRKLFYLLIIIKTSEDIRSVSEKERQLEELKVRFMSTSSHEFRTPLTTILTSSEVLLMIGRNISETRYVDYIIQIQNAVVYMTSLLDDILMMNKTEVGKWKLCPAKIDLYDFSHKMINEIRNISTRFHSFNLHYEMNNKYAVVDSKLLHQILSNLLSNAVKYSPHGGEIVIRVRNVKSDIEFAVSDNGIGIAKNNQNKLFETFYRGDNTGDIEGTGLGLSIVKRCVDSHGGRISFKSKVNKGSTFIVSIPLMAAE
jgi:signal transduction histidine kinase